MASPLLADEKLTPLHHQVYVVLRQQILEGNFPTDVPIPPEHELSRMFAVSRITIRRALDRLEAERLISRQRGKGTFALSARSPILLSADLKGTFENLMEMGLKTQVRLLEFAYVPASPVVATNLKLNPGEIVQKAVRVRSYKGTPFSHLTSYIRREIGETFKAKELEKIPLLSLLERAGFPASEAEQTVSAKLADTLVGPLLNLEPGSALLSISRKVSDQNAQPIEYLQALYRPDIYEYQVQMSRVLENDSVLWAPKIS